MSGPEGIALASCPADIVELAAFRERAVDLEQLATEQLTLSVRPGRSLILSPPAPPGTAAAHWQQAAGGRAAVVDLSSALVAFLITGPAVGALLARGCRLDLDQRAFPVGRAAATIMVQVPAILARLTPGMLLLTPATTARHMREWLVATSRPFGLTLAPDATVSELSGEGSS